MSLFQASVLNSHLRLQDRQQLEEAYQRYTTYFHNPVIQENIRNSKEEQFQATFLHELFVKVLGYTLNPNPDYNLTTEFKNESNNRKADGAILFKGVAVGVIELKGTNTKDLESIRRQAFDYKANQKGCVYVVTSNFEKLRFYVNDATEYEEFNLFELGKEEFSLLLLCLQNENIQQNLPLKIKEASLVVEEEITKKFYSDYSIFKRELYQDLVKRNLAKLNVLQPVGMEMEASEASEEVNPDESLPEQEKSLKLLLFKKSQKLIDRFLFVFFAEDRNLLPPNSTMQILDKWKADMDFGDERPIYELFKQYFGFLDTGRQGTASRAEIYAYNGGLFKPDEILDVVEIGSEMLHKHTRRLASYDFESQVDVNILGHIFENSLNEIEGMTSEIEGTDFEKQKSKRKKDGVFYTPNYITKYIVENTVGKLCEEKKQELGFREEEYYEGRSKKHKKTIVGLVKVLDDYREWLLQLSICDPACGSGAFLNQALDFLIKEHRYIDELKTKLLGGSLVLSDIETTILENNIYGVDINEESVEIAKLSLWLRTAQPRRKLNDLSSNIKCGNSLIDDPAVAGEKAFKWEEEFPEIFAKGGFDVVIGNPPYVRLQNIDELSRLFFNLSFKTAYKNYDIYMLFVERIKLILCPKGVASYIMPTKFITSDYGEKLKKFIYKENLLEGFIDFSISQIFQDATTYTGIFIFSKGEKEKFRYVKIEDEIQSTLQDIVLDEVRYTQISTKNWLLLDSSSSNLFFKLSNHKKLKNFSTSLFVGLQTSADPVYILEIRGDQLFSKHTGKYYKFRPSEIIKPLLKGAEINRYTTPNAKFKIIFPYHVCGDDLSLLTTEEFVKDFPEIWDYLNECKEKLEGREKGKMKNEKWYGYVYLKNMTEFSKPKILTQVLSKESSLTLDLDNNFYFVGGGTAGGYGIRINEELNEYVLISILNSKLMLWYIQKFASPFQGGYFAYNKSTLGEIPINQNETFENSIKILVEKVIRENDNFQSLKRNFNKFFGANLGFSYPSVKLQNWNTLSFAEFITECNKNIKKEKGTPLTKKEEFEWMDLFEENKKKAVELQQQIAQTDREIDRMVYELYGLTEEEIAIVEGT